MAEASWWYEWEGKQAGPIDQGALLDLVRAGKLRPEARVWRAGMTGWDALRNVPEVAVALPTASATPTAADTAAPSEAPRPPASPAATVAPTAAAAPTSAAPLGALPPGMEPTSTGAVIGLGLATLGIYPMVKFYLAGQAYEALAGRPSRFATYFWLSIGLALLGGPLHAAGGILGIAAHVAAIVFTILTLFEALALRAEVVKRHAVAPPLTPDSTHKALFIIGLLTSWLLVGLVLLIVQAVKFFADHRALGDALRARPAAPGAGLASAQA